MLVLPALLYLFNTSLTLYYLYLFIHQSIYKYIIVNTKYIRVLWALRAARYRDFCDVTLS